MRDFCLKMLNEKMGSWRGGLCSLLLKEMIGSWRGVKKKPVELEYRFL